MTHAAREVALDGRRKQALAAREAIRERRHLRDVLLDDGRAMSAAEDVHVLPEEFDAGVLLVHRGHDGNAELRADHAADLAARGSVAPREKRRSREEQVELQSRKHLLDPRKGLFGVRGHEIVAANDRVGDRHILERLREDPARPDHAVAKDGFEVRQILAADLSEKLVDVVYCPEHLRSLPVKSRRRS